jgi:hypothetical protein
MARCKTCGKADLIWKQERICVGYPDERLIWLMHGPHNPAKEFAYQTSEHQCPWKAVKHIEKNKRPLYWRTL